MGFQKQILWHPEHSVHNPSPLPREGAKKDLDLALAGIKPAMASEKRQKQRPERGFSGPALKLKSNLDENGCIEIKCARLWFSLLTPTSHNDSFTKFIPLA